MANMFPSFEYSNGAIAANTAIEFYDKRGILGKEGEALLHYAIIGGMAAIKEAQLIVGSVEAAND